MRKLLTTLIIHLKQNMNKLNVVFYKMLMFFILIMWLLKPVFIVNICHKVILECLTLFK